MATKAWRRASLRWPPTPEQWQALQQDLDYVYRWLRDLQANGGGGNGGSADLSNLDADNLTSGTVPAARMPALTGDVTSSVGTVATTLVASGVTAGTYGSATKVPQITVDAKGRATTITEVDVSAGGDVRAASIYRATNQTLTHDTATAISFSTEHYDDGGLADLGTQATRLTCPTDGDGVYSVKGQIALGTGFQGTVLLQIAKNGTVVASQTSVGADLASGTEYHAFGADVNMVATDYVEFKVTLVLAAGSGTFDIVGGTANTLFQGTQNSPMLSGDFAGTVVQVVNTQTGAAATGTGTIPHDDTIPQNTEGDQYMSLAVTPTSATNKLKIEVIVYLSATNASEWLTAALFQDSGTDAIAAGTVFDATATAICPLVFTHYMTAGTTSATTFKVRAGRDTAGTTTFNGQSGTRVLGGVLASSITITEIVP